MLTSHVASSGTNARTHVASSSLQKFCRDWPLSSPKASSYACLGTGGESSLSHVRAVLWPLTNHIDSGDQYHSQPYARSALMAVLSARYICSLIVGCKLQMSGDCALLTTYQVECAA